MKSASKIVVITIFCCLAVAGFITWLIVHPIDSANAVTEANGLVYKTTYSHDGFQVREAYLSQDQSFLDNFSMPAARINNPAQDLGLGKFWLNGKYGQCKAQWANTGWCTDTITITTKTGVVYSYTLAQNHIGIGGHYRLSKNDTLIWEGDLSASTEGPILSSKVIGDEIAIEYLNVISGNHPQLIESILLTRGSQVVDILETTNYDAVFAPNEIDGKLIYFAKKYGEVQNGQVDMKSYMVFDEEQIEEYDKVFNQYCCWNGPSIQVIGNGKVIDFFAKKSGAWYHVQAGMISP